MDDDDEDDDDDDDDAHQALLAETNFFPPADRFLPRSLLTPGSARHHDLICMVGKWSVWIWPAR